MRAEPEPLVGTPEWERHCRRIHAMSRLADAIGREIVRASGERKGDPELRSWLRELEELTLRFRGQAQRDFASFADSYEARVSGGGAL